MLPEKEKSNKDKRMGAMAMGRDEKAQKTAYNQLKTKEQKTNFSLFSSSVPSPELITQRVLHTHTKEQQQQQKKPLSMKEDGKMEIMPQH